MSNSTSTSTSTKHLDLGCGTTPRNPFKRQALYGIDIRNLHLGDAEIRAANLAVDPIPFESNTFDSLSAYDFLEHVPRWRMDQAGNTRFPFVELMNEIWRVLKPDGVFYASTPVYPNPSVFQDPTHVNFLTANSHLYFCSPTLMARMYGFEGDFSIVRVMPSRGGRVDYEPVVPDSIFRRFRAWNRKRKGGYSHIVWEFKAHKPGAGAATGPAA